MTRTTTRPFTWMVATAVVAALVVDPAPARAGDKTRNYFYLHTADGFTIQVPSVTGGASGVPLVITYGGPSLRTLTWALQSVANGSAMDLDVEWFTKDESTGNTTVLQKTHYTGIHVQAVDSTARTITAQVSASSPSVVANWTVGTDAEVDVNLTVVNQGVMPCFGSRFQTAASGASTITCSVTDLASFQAWWGNASATRSATFVFSGVMIDGRRSSSAPVFQLGISGATMAPTPDPKGGKGGSVTFSGLVGAWRSL
jgi:hypothetical protein